MYLFPKLAVLAAATSFAVAQDDTLQEIPLTSLTPLSGPNSVNSVDCAIVTSLAFSAAAGNINLSAGGYLRWGTDQCVLQITAPASNGATYSVAQVRHAFIQLLAGTAEQAETGASATSADQLNVNFGFSSLAYFGGDKGTPVKRSQLDSRTVLFEYGHASTPNSERSEPWTGWSNNTARSDVHEFNLRTVPAAEELVERSQHAGRSRLHRRAVCQDTIVDQVSNTFEIRCVCSGLIVEVQCNGGTANEEEWTWTSIMSTVNELFARTGDLIRKGGGFIGGNPGGSAPLITQTYSGGYGMLHTTLDRFDDNYNRCCNEAMGVARQRNPQGGRAPAWCTCIPRSPDRDWILTYTHGSIPQTSH